MMFYLGTHHPGWLSHVKAPLFISHNRLARRRTLPRALVRCGIDSGGFTVHSTGKNYEPAKAYATAVRRYHDEIGIDFAAVQDWMCEPFIRAKTGLSTREHQRRTIDSYIELMDLAPDLPWLPVLQGWGIDDYRRHVDMYTDRGVDLRSVHRVGLGSVCRRQATGEAEAIVSRLVASGLRLHLFGFKKLGLINVVGAIPPTTDLTADSAAWSFSARRAPPLVGHGARHINCANCVDYALAWRHELLSSIASAASLRPRQLQLRFGVA